MDRFDRSVWLGWWPGGWLLWFGGCMAQRPRVAAWFLPRVLVGNKGAKVRAAGVLAHASRTCLSLRLYIMIIHYNILYFILYV